MMALRTALAEELQCDLKGWGRNAPTFLICTNFLDIAEKRPP